MKKSLILLFAITLVYSCSTSSDGNGNSNTTVLPLAPTELSGTPVSSQIALTWMDNSTNESGFKIDRKVGSGNWVVDYTSLNADIINYTDTSVLEGITYSYRVCSYNNAGKSLAYSNQITVNNGIALPTINTTEVSSITQTTAMSGGNILNDGLASITAKGICWSTSPNPTISNFKTDDGTGTGAFTSNITGLTANTTYYYRAYATNNVGTGYGNESTFNTKVNSPLIPNYTFSTVLNLNLPLYSNLNFVASPLPLTIVNNIDIIVMKVSEGNYVAWNGNCPNQSLTPCSRLSIAGLNAKCNCEDAFLYSLFTGIAQSAIYPIISYQVEIMGNNSIRVFN